MAVLGIIACETLEMELAYLISHDRDIEGVTVLENDFSTRLIHELELKNVKKLKRIPHLNSFRHENSRNFEVLIRVLDMSLHQRIKNLRRVVSSAAHEMAHTVDSIALFYGLCGNAFGNIKEWLDVDVPLFLPMEKDHPVDDCVGLLLGGREIYHGQQRNEPGTYYMTPGWTLHWAKMFDRKYCGMDPDLVKRIFAGYKRSLLIVTPVMSEDEMKNNAHEFNQMLGLNVESCQGTIDLLLRFWQSAKASLISQKENNCGTNAHNSTGD